eukprot:gene9634-12210_t
MKDFMRSVGLESNAFDAVDFEDCESLPDIVLAGVVQTMHQYTNDVAQVDFQDAITEMAARVSRSVPPYTGNKDIEA